MKMEPMLRKSTLVSLLKVHGNALNVKQPNVATAKVDLSTTCKFYQGDSTQNETWSHIRQLTQSPECAPEDDRRHVLIMTSPPWGVLDGPNSAPSGTKTENSHAQPLGDVDIQQWASHMKSSPR